MSVGAAVATTLAALRARFVGWPLHPIGYMAANSWGMHWNWGSLLVGWMLKSVLLRYGGLGLFRRAVPAFIGMVVGDMLSEGIWGAVAAWVAMVALPVIELSAGHGRLPAVKHSTRRAARARARGGPV
jgi:hypothetical protein